ncbi:glycogen debranching enzyme-related protein [Candidatus Hydrogenisulfobacillus filiaventi]|uniref:Glycogen debranching enzyme-related protein n=1 Tax=Candidatus Hydrogenisulfobacillus filiaventi TaxID=2707344 RepID=A0A6F8ZC80_9FIRM|nr:glycogen debranching enzyme N-terminal domain-containing protein [Bacillota bacterium]CAB1127636.1 glycogen debranching enzyme-related protein [Candidatus Hydrogenisulfobacillus filiaventi]
MITAGPFGHETAAYPAGLEREWLLTDGLGGYAMGTAAGVLTRGYHGLLIAAARPPRARYRLLATVLTAVRREGEEIPLWTQEWGPGVLHPAGGLHLFRFYLEDGRPVWEYAVRDLRLEWSLVLTRGRPAAVLRWRWESARPCTLVLTPLVSGRDHHGMGSPEPEWRWGEDGFGARSATAPLPLAVRVPGARFLPGPVRYAHIYYRAEAERGLAPQEDLWAPGHWEVALPAGSGTLWGAAWADPGEMPPPEAAFAAETARLAGVTARARARGLPPALGPAADAFRVAGADGFPTVVAGYPWFTDWGRDTFLSLPGLALALEDGPAWARRVLEAWAGVLQEGLLPNRFPDAGEEPEWASVDAVLWFLLRVWDIGRLLGAEERERFWRALLPRLDAALEALMAGTRYGIRARPDGWLTADGEGVALTWMDARVGDWVVTPRRGRPVEVSALWVNALAARERVAAALGVPSRYGLEADHLARAFAGLYVRPDGLGLWDVLPSEGPPDPALRPNQLFALALPVRLLDAEAALRTVRTAQAHLFTPLGLYSLAPSQPGFRPRFTGPPAERDAAYHQGAIWPYLLGAYVDAWEAAAGEGRRVFRELEPALAAHLQEAGLGSVSEVLDPTTLAGRGCPFQAWSVAEVIRLWLRYGIEA